MLCVDTMGIVFLSGHNTNSKTHTKTQKPSRFSKLFDSMPKQKFISQDKVSLPFGKKNGQRHLLQTDEFESITNAVDTETVESKPVSEAPAAEPKIPEPVVSEAPAAEPKAPEPVSEAPAAEPKAPEPCLLYTSPSPRDQRGSRMPSSA